MENTQENKKVNAKEKEIKQEIKLEDNELIVPWTIRRQPGRNGSPTFYMLEGQFKNAKGVSLNLSLNLTQEDVDLINLTSENLLASIQPGSQKRVGLLTSFYSYDTEREDKKNRYIYSIRVSFKGLVNKFYSFKRTQNLTVNVSRIMGEKDKDVLYPMPFKQTSKKELIDIAGDDFLADVE